MKLLEVKPSPIKDAAGWTAESFCRLKPNNSLLSSFTVEPGDRARGLVIGVTGKPHLEALRTVVGERLEELEFGALADHALDQRARPRICA